MIHPEDVIEETLNKGVDSAAQKFNLSTDEVVKIVKPFTDEIDSVTSVPCECLKYWKDGSSMCFMCTKTPPRL